MKFAAKRFLLAFCVVLCVATAAWCAGSGPVILQRGSGPNLFNNDALRIGTVFKNFSDIFRIVYLGNNKDKGIVEFYTFSDMSVKGAWTNANLLVSYELYSIYGGNNNQGGIRVKWGEFLQEKLFGTSLKSRKEWENKKLSLDDCLKLCEPYAPLIICFSTKESFTDDNMNLPRYLSESKFTEPVFYFLYTGKEGGFRLLQYEFGIYPGWNAASIILENIGEREGIKDLYEVFHDSYGNNSCYYWIDTNRKYAIVINNDFLDVFTVVDEKTILPLFKTSYFSYDGAREEYKRELARTGGRYSEDDFERGCHYRISEKTRLGRYDKKGNTISILSKVAR